ncbi:ADP-ribosyl cyclase/cyclic ADP-ribose hydrolase 2-like [Lytechinus variegatus]|uniref:ADP-ribosyl cyclase/cyclic ADP-ribose hydrolase 2-like n=1 Tax=Lytechinus variegatus TaxID=7654 RepID=UPI001BB26019|nr:ADP-ribosyl cyclase/cyclic ADP-ribose hydrolase 2-like [Lytechinus variegatus]XP_041469319.1 ADP-ribosyl cyclase/cyclic ADP-ribose hydrolase 2-like [Lytechinus variegatus]
MNLLRVFICLSSMTMTAIAYTLPGPGTTWNMTDVLRGRCQEYRQCLHGGLCLPYYGDVQCDAAVNSFLGAIRGMDPCNTPYNAYDEFLTMAPPNTKPGTTTMWTGVSGAYIPHDVAEVSREYIVLGETFPGYMALNLSFCGSTDPDEPSGFNYTVCPTEDTDRSGCSNNTVATFWDRASELFTRQASGVVYVVLNAQRDRGAYHLESTFARIEVPAFDRTKVTNIAIYLIPDFTIPTPNNRARETCTNGTVAYLRGILDNLGLNNTCEEDPEDIMWLQCARYTDSPYCVPYRRHQPDPPLNGAKTIVDVLPLAFLMIQVVSAILISRR